MMSLIYFHEFLESTVICKLKQIGESTLSVWCYWVLAAASGLQMVTISGLQMVTKSKSKRGPQMVTIISNESPVISRIWTSCGPQMVPL